MRKSTLVWLAIFVGLLGVVVWVNLDEGSSRGMRRLGPGLVAADLERIIIQGKNPLDVRREGEAWTLADGRTADPGAMKQLVDSLARIESSELVAEGGARDAEFGVDAAEGLQVEVQAHGAQVAAFVLGKAAPGGVYLKQGEETFLVAKVFPSAFSRPASGWHQLKLFEAKVEEASRVEVELAGQPAFALEAKEGVWSLAAGAEVPTGFRFDPHAGRSLAMALVNARAIDLVLEPVDATQTGLQPPAARLAFVDGQGQRHELRLGANRDEQGVYAQVEGKPDVFVLAQASARLLRKELLDLRDLKLMALDPSRVVRLRIEPSGGRLVLEKGEQGWRLQESSEAAPPGFELDGAAVERRLAALAGARAYGLAPAGTRGRASPDRPTGRVVAELQGGGEAVLAFGLKDKVYDREGVYARGNADAEVYMLDPGTEKNLLGGLESFRKVERPRPPAGRPMPQGLDQLPPEVRAKLLQQMQGR